MCCFQFHCFPSRNELMSHKNYPPRALLRTSKLRLVVTLTVIALAAVQLDKSAAQSPTISLTQIGSPIWRPTDFQIFSAPGYTDEDDERTRAAIRPLDPPSGPYTTPHGPPYDSELSSNMA